MRIRSIFNLVLAALLIAPLASSPARAQTTRTAPFSAKQDAKDYGSFTFDTPAGTVGLSIFADDARFGTITQLGRGSAVKVYSAKRLTIERLIAATPQPRDYAFYSGVVGGEWCDDLHVRTFNVLVAPHPTDPKKHGQHGDRNHRSHRVFLGDYVETFPFDEGHPGYGFAGYIAYRSPYNGSAITLKEGDDDRIVRVKTGHEGEGGAVSFGPLADSYGDDSKPDWRTLRLNRLVIDRCEFNVGKFYFDIGPGVVDLLVIGGRTHARGGACLAIRGGRTEWPDPNGVFFAHKFYGEKLAAKWSTDNGMLKRFFFLACTFNDQPLGLHGEVLDQRVN